LIPYGRHTVNWRDALTVGWQVKTKSLTQGHRIQEFEEKIASYVGSKYAVAVSSATAGLHLALLALNLPKGSQVSTSPISFVSTSNSILFAGLTPHFVDIDSKNLNLSPTKFESSLKENPKISAVIPVHFAGLSCEMQAIHESAQKYGVKVIEDAAHALGASYATGEKIGSCIFSDVTVFSFHPVKSVTTGEGGVITTNDYHIYQKLLQLRSHGINKQGIDLLNPIHAYSNGELNPWYYEMQTLGFHYRLTEIQAALGISQMNRIDEFMHKRNEIRRYYDGQFQNSTLVTPAQKENREQSGNHIYPLRISFDKLKINRAQLFQELKNKGIGTQVHYIPIPMHPYYAELGYKMADLPNSMKYYAEALTVPMFPKLTKQNRTYVAKTLLEILNMNSL